MLKINELNRMFKAKLFSSSYNKLLGHAKGLARLVDLRDAVIRKADEELKKLEEENRALKDKYFRARDIKTGRFASIK